MICVPNVMVGMIGVPLVLVGRLTTIAVNSAATTSEIPWTSGAIACYTDFKLVL